MTPEPSTDDPGHEDEDDRYDGFMTHGKDGAMDEDDLAEMFFPPTQLNDGFGLLQCTTNQLMDSELKIYLGSELKERVDPLDWWRENRQNLPMLALMANRYLCSPPSSVESERLFSIGGCTYQPKRSRLLPQNGETLITLAFNLKHFSGITEICNDSENSKES